MTIKILLAGRHESMRLSLRSILAGREGLSIVGEAVADAEIFGLARGVSPDLILLDVEMPDLTGLEVIRRLHQELPEVRIMALAIHSDKRFVRETLNIRPTRNCWEPLTR